MLAAFGDGRPSDEPHIPPAMLLDQVTRADKLGIDIAYHAVGDKAVRSVLDAVQAMEKVNPPRDRRFRIEHIEVVSPDDLLRFKTENVIASMMPIHAEPSSEIEGGVWSQMVGKARLPYSFAFRALDEAGARLAFGSDWPVAPLDPLPGIAVAVTRQNASGLPPGGYVGTQRISMDTALHGFTTGAAYATRLEGETGKLVRGMSADFVVLDATAKLDDAKTFFTTHVESTWVRGKPVYDAKGRR
jgi:predicted amidohydrolase YtcJ